MQYTLIVSQYLSLQDIINDSEFITIAKDYVDIYLYVPIENKLWEISINAEIGTSRGQIISKSFETDFEEVDNIKEVTGDKVITHNYCIKDKNFHEMISEVQSIVKDFLVDCSVPSHSAIDFKGSVRDITYDFPPIDEFEKFRLAYKMKSQLKEKINSQKMKI